MYTLKHITPKELANLKVNNQQQITELTGSPFRPEHAYSVIKQQSEGFSKPDQKAQEADRLFAQLLRKNGIGPAQEGKEVKKGKEDKYNNSNNPAADSKDRIRIAAQARERAIKLIELELELAA